MVDGPGLEPGNNLDAAWNPRNKHLADKLYLIDSICGVQTGQSRRDCIPEAATDRGVFGTLFSTKWFSLNWINSKAQHTVVAQVNSKFWPVTQQDIDHAKANQQYMDCAAPGITSGPGLTHVSGSQFNLSWNNSSGCAPVTSTYNFCFNVAYGGGGKVEPFCRDFQVTSGQTSGNETITLSWEFSGSWRSLELVSLEISPRDRAYPSWATSYPTVEFANIWAFRTRPGSD